ncbi:MAG: M56 family metallopeptidase [Desulfobacteraceae bacterium]|jgi:beta-lactamase regulating signal transducer with metallopeptidase domain
MVAVDGKHVLAGQSANSHYNCCGHDNSQMGMAAGQVCTVGTGFHKEHVMLHELCHLKRGDLLVHWFCIALQIVYWFNPLLIWSRRQMRHICEICCDLSVANVLREKTAAYRETLLRTARELFAESLEPSIGFLGIFEEPFRLVPRLKWLEKRSWKNRKG